MSPQRSASTLNTRCPSRYSPEARCTDPAETAGEPPPPPAPQPTSPIATARARNADQLAFVRADAGVETVIDQEPEDLAEDDLA
ncbi:hypothetical protein ACWDTB_34685, partial [Streptomyces sp. NPDC003487]